MSILEDKWGLVECIETISFLKVRVFTQSFLFYADFLLTVIFSLALHLAWGYITLIHFDEIDRAVSIDILTILKENEDNFDKIENFDNCDTPKGKPSNHQQCNIVDSEQRGIKSNPKSYLFKYIQEKIWFFLTIEGQVSCEEQ